MCQTIQIHLVSEKDYPEIVDVWEASVRATHDFLSESDIQYFRPLILQEYLKLVDLRCTRDKGGRITGFSGVADQKMEMLFIHPDHRGCGIGKQLLLYAVHRQGIREVDVNEQNEEAVGFYKHLGFVVKDRSPLDGLGKPYPILHLALPDSY